MVAAEPNSDKLRQQMVAQQIEARGIHDARVLQAMLQVPREEFLPGVALTEVYADRAQPIDCAQTISQPYIVALMTDALELSGGECVLEIGTGSGYQTAILSQIADRVVSIERHAELLHTAARRLQSLGISNVECQVGDGMLGSPAEAPFAGILVAAGTSTVPPALLDQLADGGRLVIPLGDEGEQMLQVYHRQGEQVFSTNLTACRFVPLVGGEQEPD